MYLPWILRFIALAAPLVNAMPTFGDALVRYMDKELQDAADAYNSVPGKITEFTTTMEHVVATEFDALVQYTDKELHDAAEAYTSLAEKITEFKATMEHVVTTKFDALVRYAHKELQDAAEVYTSVAGKIIEFEATMEHVVASATEFAEKMRSEGVDLDKHSEKLAAELNTVLEELKVEFSHPLSEDQTPRQADRDKMISSALSKVEEAVVRVTAVWGVSEDTSRAHFKELEPHVKTVLFICGQVIDDHPILVELLLFTGAALIIPEGVVLRPILSLFGFGRYGPVKGSPVAWAQSRFWGAAVAEGSWFARMQSAGMKFALPGRSKAIAGSFGASIRI